MRTKEGICQIHPSGGNPSCLVCPVSKSSLRRECKFCVAYIIGYIECNGGTVLQQEDNFDGNFTASNRVFKVSYDISWSYRTDRTY